MTKAEALMHANNLKAIAQRNLVLASVFAFAAGTLFGEAINRYARYAVFKDREEVMRSISDKSDDA